MSWLCCSSIPSTSLPLAPEPLKFKVLRSLNILNPLIGWLILPKKKTTYTKIPRKNLQFLNYKNNHIPILYFPTLHPQKNLLLIYSHGSGSNLDNVHNFAQGLRQIYGVNVIAYDYSGEGQSRAEFGTYHSDILVVLAWALRIGFKMESIVLCGFSIGSFPALVLDGPMPRILISPICGLIPLIQGTNNQYDGQFFDNIENAQKISSRTLIIHSSTQMIPFSHAQSIRDSLLTKNKSQTIQLIKIEGVHHLQMPSMIFMKSEVQDAVRKFLEKVAEDCDRITSQGSITTTIHDNLAELVRVGEQIVVEKSIRKQ